MFFFEGCINYDNLTLNLQVILERLKTSLWGHSWIGIFSGQDSAKKNLSTKRTSANQNKFIVFSTFEWLMFLTPNQKICTNHHILLMEVSHFSIGFHRYQMVIAGFLNHQQYHSTLPISPEYFCWCSYPVFPGLFQTFQAFEILESTTFYLRGDMGGVDFSVFVGFLICLLQMGEEKFEVSPTNM